MNSQCFTCGARIGVNGASGDAFCSAACRSEYITFIAAEVAAAVIRFKNRTPAQKQRIADYNDWAARVSSASAGALPAA